MKKILLAFSLLIVSIAFSSCTKEPGTVNGVVTYYFNKYQGYKPDVGAKVYFTTLNCDSLKIALDIVLSEEMIDLYEYSIANTRVLIANSNNQEDVQEYSKELSDKEKDLADAKKSFLDIVKDSANVESFMVAGLKNLTNIKQAGDKETFTTSVDGSGNFTISLAPNTYTMIVVSKGRDKTNLVEISGRVITKTVTVKSKETLSESVEIGM